MACYTKRPITPWAPKRPNRNFHKYYDCIFVIVKEEIHRVFQWLYKGGTEHVGDYLKRHNINIEKGFLAPETTALNDKIPTSEYDIPFLYKLLHRSCDLYPHRKKKDPHKLEKASVRHTLEVLRDERNKFCHAPEPLMQMSDQDFDSKVNDLLSLCKCLIENAAKLANESNTHLYVQSVEKALNELRRKPIPSGITASKFALLASHETKMRHQAPLTLFDKFVMPLIHSEKYFGCFEAPLKVAFTEWRCANAFFPTRIILRGEPGSGKSSVCQYIYESWLSSRDAIEGLQGYDLVVQVQCCKVTTRNLIDFLGGIFADTISSCDRDEVRDFLQSLRILWLVDGFEEATNDALHILKAIDELGESQLMFCTTRPQNRSDLLDIITSKSKVLQACLVGFTEEGVAVMVNKSLKHELGKHGKDFIDDVKAFREDIWIECINPLKLKLMIDLWTQGKLTQESSKSYALLYKGILDVQEAKLLENIKMIKRNVKDRDMLKRTRAWIDTLCETAFKMTLEGKCMQIDTTFQNTLEDATLGLPIASAEDCLSIFLRITHHASGNISYCFTHSTQQYFLAAQHLWQLMQRDPGAIETVRATNGEISDHVYSMLLLAVSEVAQQETINEALMKMLIDLTFNYRLCDFFQVIRYTLYSPRWTHEVKECIQRYQNVYEKWCVDNESVKAAHALLKVMTPKDMLIKIARDPKYQTSLTDLIQDVSKTKLNLKLCLECHLRSNEAIFTDPYLLPVCSSDATCTLTRFVGNLSIPGCQKFLQMPNLNCLELRVDSDDVLKNILLGLPHLTKLQILIIWIKMPVVNTPEIEVKLNPQRFLLIFTDLDETQIERTALAFCSIHSEYHTIMHIMEEESATLFQSTLEAKSVKVQYMIKYK